MSISAKDVALSARLAGRVRRYHTWPTLQDQTNADHTWHVMRIYWQVFGPMSPEVSSYLLTHDMGEHGVGDLPFPTKSQDPQLKSIISSMEDRSLRQTMGDAAAESVLQLTPVERRRCKVCDLLEMLEFGMLEEGMGNRLAAPIVQRTYDAACDLAQQLPAEDRARVDAFMRKMKVWSKE